MPFSPKPAPDRLFGHHEQPESACSDVPSPRDALRAALGASIARLVARAAAEQWPIRADHCFLRIVYDGATGAKWDTRHARPAWRTLPLPIFAAALALAERIERDGRPALIELNALSVRFRRRA